MCRSSIFSSDSLSLRGWRPWGLSCALAVLLLIEVGLARRPWIWSARQRSPVWVQETIETELIPTVEVPVIVVLGNSRIMSMISPRILEQSLGLPSGTVVNAAITEGNPYDCLNMYRRNRRRFSQARLVIVGLDGWTVVGRTPGHERVRRYATLRDRVTLFRGHTRLSLVAGYFWRTLDAHKAIARFLISFVRPPKTTRIIADGRSRWNPFQTLSDRGPAALDDPEGDARRFYRRFEPGYASVAPLRKLLELADEDEVDVLFCRPPLRDEFLSAVETHWPMSEEQLHSLKDAMGEAGRHRLRIHVYGGAQDISLPQDYFYDYGHLLPIGAHYMSRHFAQVLRDVYGPRFLQPAESSTRVEMTLESFESSPGR